MDRLKNLYDRQVKPLIEDQSKEVKKQVADAFKTPPANPDEVDSWFVKNLHCAPVSDDGILLRRLDGVRASIRDAVGG